MNKILSVVVTLLIISSNLYANEAQPVETEELPPAAEEEAPWPFACEYEKIKNFTDKRYLSVASNDANPSILIDTRTLLIDKKNKKIKTWVISVASVYGREIKMKDYPSEDYSDYGSNRVFLTINYQNRTYSSSLQSDQTCRGNVILDFNSISPWTMIAPGSVGEGILDVITEKYKLK